MKMEMQESIGEKKELILLPYTSQDLTITASYPKKVFLAI